MMRTHLLTVTTVAAIFLACERPTLTAEDVCARLTSEIQAVKNCHRKALSPSHQVDGIVGSFEAEVGEDPAADLYIYQFDSAEGVKKACKEEADRIQKLRDESKGTFLGIMAENAPSECREDLKILVIGQPTETEHHDEIVRAVKRFRR